MRNKKIIKYLGVYLIIMIGLYVYCLPQSSTELPSVILYSIINSVFPIIVHVLLEKSVIFKSNKILYWGIISFVTIGYTISTLGGIITTVITNDYSNSLMISAGIIVFYTGHEAYLLNKDI